MHSITIVATVHNERGLCNSIELYRIIEQIRPDVIFEELSPNGFSAIYDGSGIDNLETIAIKSYMQKYPIEHIPVDMDNTEYLNMSFRNDIVELFGIFERFKDYNKLSYEHEVLTNNSGFPYLNSEQCGELLVHKNSIEKDVLKFLNNERLSQLHEVWLELHNKRENEMIKNIYEYSVKNKYNRALFLIGVVHRNPLKAKIEEYCKKEIVELNWNFDFWRK